MHTEHKAAVPQPVIAEIEALFQQILAKLAPYQNPLTADERREMALVGDKTIVFLEKGKNYVELYPDLVPAWSKKEDFAADFDDVHNLTPIKNLADQVQTAIYDVFYTAGHEAYHWMLDYYHSVKQAALRDVPNAKIVAEELGKRFQNRGRKPAHPAE